jgi:hypothetical protein
LIFSDRPSLSQWAILPDAHFTHNAEFPFKVTWVNCSHQGPKAVENVAEGGILRQFEDNDSGILVGWKLNRIRKIEVESHKAAPLASANIDQYMVGCAAKPLAYDGFDIEPAIKEKLTAATAKVFVELDPHANASI